MPANSPIPLFANLIISKTRKLCLNQQEPNCRWPPYIVGPAIDRFGPVDDGPSDCLSVLMPPENVSGITRMPAGFPLRTVCLLACLSACLSSLPGCAQMSNPFAKGHLRRYRPSTLPQHLAAKPVSDYSQIDLTPFAKASADPEQLQPGDRLAIQVNTGVSGEEGVEDWNVGIDEKGDAYLPQIGAVNLAGLTHSEAEQSIVQASQSRHVFLTPAVDIELKERPQRTVTVMGAVNLPGQITVGGGETSLADVLVQAGGLSPAASGRITISGGSIPASAVAPTSIGHRAIAAQTISLSNSSPSESAETLVPPGAVVTVEQVPQRGIQVVGVIRNQVVDLPPGKNIRLLDALTMAGGPTYSNWILDRVDVIRKSPDGQGTIRIKCSIRRAKNNTRENIMLASHDVVSVEENIVTFTLSTVQSLFAVGTSGMRLAVP